MKKRKKKKQIINQLSCGICNINVEDWDKHVKTKQHQKYLNSPDLITKMFAESQTNLFRNMIGAKQVQVKLEDQIDKTNANDLWNWHVAVRDSGGDLKELKRNIKAIYLFLLNKYGKSDYRTLHVKKIFELKIFYSQDLEDIRYIIHAEAEGITHETDNVHGFWLKTLKDSFK